MFWWVCLDVLLLMFGFNLLLGWVVCELFCVWCFVVLLIWFLFGFYVLVFYWFRFALGLLMFLC